MRRGEVLDLIWECGPEDATDRLLLLAIHWYTNTETRAAWPSVATLARRACCSDRHARRRLAALELDGWIVRAGRGGRSTTNVYLIVEERLLTGVNPDAHVRLSASKTRTSTTETRTSATQNPDTHVRRIPEEYPKNPPPRDRTLEPAPDPGAWEADDEEIRVALAGFPSVSWSVEIRHALGDALVERGHTATSVNGYLRANVATDGSVRLPTRLVARKLREIPPYTESSTRRPEWCGECHSSTARWRKSPEGVEYDCPVCHPDPRVRPPVGCSPVARSPGVLTGPDEDPFETVRTRSRAASAAVLRRR